MCVRVGGRRWKCHFLTIFECAFNNYPLSVNGNAHAGLARGIMNGRGQADGPRVARPMLKDYVRGAKLRHCAIPPGDSSTQTTTPFGVGTYTSRSADPDASVFEGQQVAGTTAHNMRYISAVDDEFFHQGAIRALHKDKLAQGKLGNKKHNKKGRKEKTRRMVKKAAKSANGSHGNLQGFSFVGN